ncbi:MAG: T9SS type A sorting domain-containing protein [Bacteroidetes bacterium]|nr:T9SS type A sorting domain-containing protein [Bacteroidota bacterium]
MKTLLPLIIVLFLNHPLLAQSWQSVYESNTGYYRLASTENGNVFAYKPDTLLMSTSDGDSATWTFLPTPHVVVNAYFYAFKNTLFILDATPYTASYQPIGLYRSDDFGNSWQSCNGGLGSGWQDGLNLSYLGDSSYMLIMKGTGVYYSINNALTWHKSTGVISGLCFARAGQNTIAAGSNFLFLSTNNGATFNKLSIPTQNNGITRIYSLNDSTVMLYNSVWAGGMHFITDTINRKDAAMKGIDSGQHCGQFTKSPIQNTYYMATFPEGNIYGGGDLYFSVDDGDNWVKCDTGLPAKPSIPVYSPNTILVTTKNYVYVSLNNGNIYRSTIRNTSIKKVKKQWTISAYPNPANEYIDVALPNDLKNAVITILDLKGAVLQEQTVITPVSHINISGLIPGSYVVRVSNINELAFSRFIKY